MRLALELTRRLDSDISRGARRLFLYRLWARLRFQTTHGWSEAHTALIDTGATYSLIPLSVWPSLRARHLARQTIRGIVPDPHAELSGDVVTVSARLCDEIHRSPRLTLYAMLAETNHVPLILGWAGCLDRARLVVDAPHRRAWLEF